MSFLGDVGKALIGKDFADVQAQAAEAGSQLQIAFSTLIALQAIMALELFLLLVMSWKERH